MAVGNDGRVWIGLGTIRSIATFKSAACLALRHLPIESAQVGDITLDDSGVPYVVDGSTGQMFAFELGEFRPVHTSGRVMQLSIATTPTGLVIPVDFSRRLVIVRAGALTRSIELNIPEPHILKAITGDDGNLYVVARAGDNPSTSDDLSTLYRINTATFAASRLAQMPLSRETAIDAKSTVWFIDYSRQLFRWTKGALSKIGAPGDALSLASYASGTIVGTRTGVVTYPLDGGSPTIMETSGLGGVTAVAERAGTIYFGTDQGVFGWLRRDKISSATIDDLIFASIRICSSSVLPPTGSE